MVFIINHANKFNEKKKMNMFGIANLFIKRFGGNSLVLSKKNKITKENK